MCGISEMSGLWLLTCPVTFMQLLGHIIMNMALEVIRLMVDCIYQLMAVHHGLPLTQELLLPIILQDAMLSPLVQVSLFLLLRTTVLHLVVFTELLTVEVRGLRLLPASLPLITGGLLLLRIRIMQVLPMPSFNQLIMAHRTMVLLVFIKLLMLVQH